MLTVPFLSTALISCLKIRTRNEMLPNEPWSRPNILELFVRFQLTIKNISVVKRSGENDFSFAFLLNRRKHFCRQIFLILMHTVRVLILGDLPSEDSFCSIYSTSFRKINLHFTSKEIFSIAPNTTQLAFTTHKKKLFTRTLRSSTICLQCSLMIN